MPKSTSAQAVVVANDQVAEKSLLDQIADQVHAGPEPGPNLSPAELEEAKAARGRIRRRGKDLIKEFIAQVLDGTITVAKDAEMMINARIAQIDHLVSLQLNEIMHHPSLQKLEGTWRGLAWLAPGRLLARAPRNMRGEVAARHREARDQHPFSKRS